MPASKAERNRQNAASRNRYRAKAYDLISFRVRRDSEDGVDREAIKQAAEAAGMSVNAWIIQAIKDKL